MPSFKSPLEALRHHVSGAIARGEAEPIVGIPADGEEWISEMRALAILTGDGDYSETQAAIILGHSLKKADGVRTLYPAAYIRKRASDNAARED